MKRDDHAAGRRPGDRVTSTGHRISTSSRCLTLSSSAFTFRPQLGSISIRDESRYETYTDGTVATWRSASRREAQQLFFFYVLVASAFLPLHRKERRDLFGCLRDIWFARLHLPHHKQRAHSKVATQGPPFFLFFNTVPKALLE